MTGGSLGLRSGSYGSLQQVHNNAAIALPINTTPPVSVRKNSKMLLPGYREKDRRLSWICKLASRKKVGMSLLVIISIAVVLSFLFSISKGLNFFALFVCLVIGSELRTKVSILHQFRVLEQL